MKNKLFYFLFVIVLFFGCKNSETTPPLPFYNTPDFTPEWIKNTSNEYSKIHTIRPFSFTNQNGKVVTENTFKGKIYVADFFFTVCPGICPQLTKNMGTLQETFKDDEDILLLSHTVTPWMDSVAQLKAYAETHQVIDNKWHLVTGDQEKLYSIARQSYFAEKDIGIQKTADDFLHTENFILIDKKSRIRGVYNGTLPLDVERLKEDIYTLKKEGP